MRQALDLDFVGRVFEDNFLIADVMMDADFPVERWFWFDPPFNRGQSALLHKQPDNVLRIDLQLGWDIDREAEKKPENVIPRLQPMLGNEIISNSNGCRSIAFNVVGWNGFAMAE